MPDIEYLNLWKEFKDKGSQKARQELIIKYLPVAKYQAGRIKMIVPDFIEKGDLEGFGIIGLINAIERFDYRIGVKFITFANKRVRGEIIDHLRRLDWLPGSLRRDGRRLMEVADRLKKELGREASIDELSDELKITSEKILSLFKQLYSSQWISLYSELGESNILNIIKDDSRIQPENILQNKESQRILVKAINCLTKDERLVISLYYYEELTQTEIADIMNLSTARVSQLHKKAIYRLRGFLSRKKKEIL